ncbi:glucokinase [Tulasnella sp. 418]|nr:glucokinase [Tulasnella sp. 418]
MSPSISTPPPIPSPLRKQLTPPPPTPSAPSKTSQQSKMAPKAQLVPQLSNLPEATRDELARIEKQFELNDERLRIIVDQFVSDFRKGLGKYGEPMAMIPTFVTGVPNGTETGTFLALDLGGTNLRVCEITLNGDQTFTLRQQKYKVSTELKTGEATTLFDYMADSVDHFLTGRDIHGEEALFLGLTFSFPVEQTALDKGVLLTWTKGFAAKNAVGHDVVKLLQDAFDRKHLHVKCTALLNDTVGALMSRAYMSGGCLLGAIFGTGTNGAYVEKTKNITKLDAATRKSLEHFEEMIINTEWGAFDNARRVLPVTQFDNKVDRESINPRYQLFEKFISGMYQGEICRNLLLYLIDNNYLFNGYSTAQLNTHYGFDTALMSSIETPVENPLHPAVVVDEANKTTTTADTFHPNSTAQSANTRKILVENLHFRPEQISDEDTEIVLWACKTVATRASRLSGCAVATVFEQTGMKNKEGTVDVGVDGSMVEFYPFFEERLREALVSLIGAEGNKKVVIGLAKDGSGVGGWFYSCSSPSRLFTDCLFSSK